MGQINELQFDMWEWQEKNFGKDTKPSMLLLGVAEEVGELCHAQLKGEQGIRHTPEEILDMKIDAVGDIFIYLANYCSASNLSIEGCILKAWKEVQKRNWKENSNGS